jgi:RNA polymerase sigma-70 factor (ECF subfamily)
MSNVEVFSYFLNFEKNPDQSLMPQGGSPSNVCEEKVFESLFMQLSKSLRDYLYYLSGNMVQSEDQVQDIFFKLWEKCKDVAPEKARAFLFKLAKNRFLTSVEKQKVRLRYKASQGNKRESEDPQFQMESAEFKDKVEKAIAALPEGQREVFLMNRIEKMTYAQIAESLGVSQKAIEKRMSKALKKMKDVLHPNVD